MDEGESDPDERPESGDDAGGGPSEPTPQGADESPAGPAEEPDTAAEGAGAGEDADGTAVDDTGADPDADTADADADSADADTDSGDADTATADADADWTEGAGDESVRVSGDASDDPFPFPNPDGEGAGDGPEDGPASGPADLPDDESGPGRIDFNPKADPHDAAEAAGEGDETEDDGEPGDRKGVPGPDSPDSGTRRADESARHPEEAARHADEPGGASADPHAVDGGEAAPAEAAAAGESREEVPVPGGAAAPSPASPEPAGGDFGAGAPGDQEMPLAAHVEEMVKRLAVVLVIMAIVSAITFPFADRLINFLWYSFLPGSPQACLSQPAEAATSANQACPRVYHPLSLMLARLKTSSMVGLIAALPVLVYESYLFMRPGLYPNEKRYYLASVPTSLVLAAVGVGFAYFLVLPVIFTYFLGYSLHAVDTIAFSLTQTFDLILLMMGLFALVFQIPLFMMLAIMMGVTTRRWLQRRRIYFWGGFLGIAFLFSPDPTGMAPFIVAITMVFLFEGTLLLLRWTGR